MRYIAASTGTDTHRATTITLAHAPRVNEVLYIVQNPQCKCIEQFVSRVMIDMHAHSVLKISHCCLFCLSRAGRGVREVVVFSK